MVVERQSVNISYEFWQLDLAQHISKMCCYQYIIMCRNGSRDGSAERKITQNYISLT